MPVIARFYGIVIKMYFLEHGVPHFHAIYAEFNGVFAIECMALGKPVLCRIDEHFIKYYPDLPVVNTDPDTLYDNLKMLIKDHDLRIDIGKRSRIFVEETHDARKIAEQLAQLYRSL